MTKPTINQWINLKALLFEALNSKSIKENWKYPRIKKIAFDSYVSKR